MNAVLQANLDAVAFGTQVLKQGLVFTEQRPVGSDKNSQKNVLEQLARRVMKLEFDVSALMARYMCVAFRSPVGRTSQVLDELWGVFLILDCMYADLNMLCKDANEQGFHPVKLKELQVSWVRLNKLTKQAGKRLAEGRLLTTSRA
jgi:hypothetical protein